MEETIKWNYNIAQTFNHRLLHRGAKLNLGSVDHPSDLVLSGVNNLEGYLGCLYEHLSSYKEALTHDANNILTVSEEMKGTETSICKKFKAVNVEITETIKTTVEAMEQ